MKIKFMNERNYIMSTRRTYEVKCYWKGRHFSEVISTEYEGDARAVISAKYPGVRILGIRQLSR